MKNKKRHIKWKVLFSIIALLIIVRLVLPYVLLHYANKTLAKMDGYYGHISDLDLSLYRGAYTIEDLYIDKIDSTSQEHVPFISSEVIDLSVEWKSLFYGRIVGELQFINPVVRFTKEKAEPAAIQEDTTDFREVLKTFMPLDINRFEVLNGEIQYIDSTSNPKVNISITKANVLALNLSSVSDTALLPASVAANANVYGGFFNLNMKLNPLADSPTLDLNVELKNTNLPELNDFFKAYANFDVNAGSFGLFAEIATLNGAFTGYVKPIIKDLKVIGPEDRNDTFFNKVYERLVGTAGIILKNRKEKQVATKVPLNGRFDSPKIGAWYAIIEVLRNAFIQALYPSIDNEITIFSVNESIIEDDRSFVKKVFSKD